MSYTPLITFAREGDAVKVTVDTGLAIERHRFVFSFDAGSEAYAELLTQQTKAHVYEAIRSAREESYAAGYRHGRAKRARDMNDSPYLGRHIP